MHLCGMLTNEAYNSIPRTEDDMNASPEKLLFSVYDVFYEILRVFANQRKPFFKFGGYKPNINCSTLN